MTHLLNSYSLHSTCSASLSHISNDTTISYQIHTPFINAGNIFPKCEIHPPPPKDLPYATSMLAASFQNMKSIHLLQKTYHMPAHMRASHLPSANTLSDPALLHDMQIFTFLPLFVPWDFPCRCTFYSSSLLLAFPLVCITFTLIS